LLAPAGLRRRKSAGDGSAPAISGGRHRPMHLSCRALYNQRTLSMALLYDGWMLKPLLSLAVLIALLVFGATAATPTLTGPITAAAPAGDSSHQYPFFAALEDLKGRGYIEQEFFVSGTANR